MTPVFVALTPAGLAMAQQAQAALGGEVHAKTGSPPHKWERGTADPILTFSDTAAHLRCLFAAGRPIVGICASGILIRILAPLVSDKRDEPPVLAVSEDGAEIVPLLGGHRGANDLARQLASALGGHAAITTAGDRRFGMALDAPPPGWTLANPEDAKPAMAALLAGASARIEGECDWLRGGHIPQADDGLVRLIATTRAITGDERTLVYHPQRLAVGIGCERNVEPAEVVALLTRTIEDAGLAPASVACIVSIDLKADEPAVLAAAAHLGVPARFFPAEQLEREAPRMETPSETVFREVGCHGVAEGAALAAVGPAGRLAVAKRKSARATCALAEADDTIDPYRVGRARGRLAVVGIGPGAIEWLTPEARALLQASDAAVGYSLYLDLVAPLIAGAERFDSELGSEEARVRLALALAGEGRSVALVSSGDAGIYAMATLVFEVLERSKREPLPLSSSGEQSSTRGSRFPHPILGPRAKPEGDKPIGTYARSAGDLPDGAWRAEITVAPGISAMQAAAARAGAPLGHDFCAISLSDLLTPWPAIEARIRAAAEADFVVAFYNPVSQRRDWQLAAAKAILLRHRPPETPVVLARNLGRDGESVTTVPLGDLAVDAVDMLTLVLVGASTTRQAEASGRTWTYTPRGYEKKRGPSPPLRGRDGEGGNMPAAALHPSPLPTPTPQGGRE